jgi:hypothetical protein
MALGEIYMKSVEFQFVNGIIYPGESSGVSFIGDDLIFITENVRKNMISDIMKSRGSLTVSNPKALIKKLNSARLGQGDARIPIWGIPAVILKDLQIIEYSKSISETQETEYKELVLNSNYFDIFKSTPEENLKDMNVGEKKVMEEGVVATYWGKHNNLADAINRINELGASDRTSVLPNEQDQDVMFNNIVARRYKSPHRKVGNLCDYIEEVPLDVIKGENSFIERWANQILSEAQENKPDVAWFMGNAPLMTEINRLQKINNSF